MMEEALPNIRYIKLSSGEEIVGHVICDNGDSIEIDNPKKILTQYMSDEEDGSIYGSYAFVSFMKGSSETLINMGKQHIVCDVKPEDYLMEDWLVMVAAELEESETELSDDAEEETKVETNVIKFGRKPIRT